MSIKFPLSEKLISLGRVIDPIITLPILTKFGWKQFDFIVDSGADCTMLPKSAAKLLDIDINTCKKDRFFGIEGKGVTVYISEITVKIGKKMLALSCVFSEIEITPFILGRLDFFNHENTKKSNHKSYSHRKTP